MKRQANQTLPMSPRQGLRETVEALLGNQGQSKYKHAVLGPILLNCMFDHFEARRHEVGQELEADDMLEEWRERFHEGWDPYLMDRQGSAS